MFVIISNLTLLKKYISPLKGHSCPLAPLSEGEGEGEVAFFSAKRWDRRNRADLIESATPCHDALVVGSYRDSNPLRLTVLAAMSEDYTTAPQHLLRKGQEGRCPRAPSPAFLGILSASVDGNHCFEVRKRDFWHLTIFGNS